MHFHGRAIARVLLVAPIVALASSCAAIGSRASDYNFACPDTPLLQLSLLDISASGRDRDILAERLNAIQVDAERVADCDGELVVVAWGGSASSSHTLYSSQMRVAGASEIGRDRRIPEVVGEVMSEVRGALNEILPATPASGLDMLAAFSIVSDFVRSKGVGTPGMAVHIYADGVSTEGTAQINVPGLNATRVQEIISEQGSFPQLTGVTIQMFGIGRVGGGSEPPQQVVDATLLYAQALCEATGATCSTYSTTFSTD